MKKIIQATVIAFLITVFIPACEDSGSLGDGHDFGDNNHMVCVALGDSITEGHGLSDAETYPSQLASFLGKTVINEGNGGENSSGGASRVSGVLKSHKPGFLLILYGANDLLHDVDQASTISALRSIIQTAKNNQTIPVIATLTPMTDSYILWAGGVEELNIKIRSLASETGTTLVDLESAFGDGSGLMAEGLHPNAQGAYLMAQCFADVF